jgi:RNA recognition motif-containing protein
MKIFVGNLSGQTTEDDLRQAFESFGQVTSITMIMDADEGKSRGFGFVIMPSVNEAQNAIKKMHGKDFRGRKISVEKSRTNTKARASRRKRSGSAARGRADPSGHSSPASNCRTGGGRRGKSGGRRGRRRR